jgi:2,4-dienoyl-CoA reductase-like NADH-dependent reductase (Old Yellow Enzyme family)
VKFKRKGNIVYQDHEVVYKKTASVKRVFRKGQRLRILVNRTRKIGEAVKRYSEMEGNMSQLFEPVRIANLELRNRFVRSATYYGLADTDGFIGDASVELMKTLAQNEVGLIITGYAYFLKSGQVPSDMNGIQDDDHIPGYRKMTKAVHELDGRIVMQIVHGGAASFSAAQGDGDYLAVSLVDKMPAFRRRPREMNEADIVGIIEAFGQAARRVQEAGFDGVQIHGAHGYLVSQFLSPRTNQRTDRWGGSLENRMRFVIEVARAIKREVNDDFPVMIKLGVRDYLEFPDAPVWGTTMGKQDLPDIRKNRQDDALLTIQEGAQVAKALEREGISFIEISNGFLGKSSHKIHMGIVSPDKEAYFLEEARVIREATEAPLSLVAGMRSIPVMEEIISSGVVDCISLCRPLIREPGLIKRWKMGDTRPADCISCGGCFNVDENKKMHIYCRQLKEK